MSKRCRSCGLYTHHNDRYCSRCGTPFSETSLIPTAVPEDYASPYGTWKVTTEGDCEGRSTRTLGVYKGYIDDIARYLAPECYYSLQFEPAMILEVTPEVLTKSGATQTKETSVSLDIRSKTWDMNMTARKVWYQNLLAGRDVKVKEGTYYASVKLMWEN